MGVDILKHYPPEGLSFVWDKDLFPKPIYLSLVEYNACKNEENIRISSSHVPTKKETWWKGIKKNIVVFTIYHKVLLWFDFQAVHRFFLMLVLQYWHCKI